LLVVHGLLLDSRLEPPVVPDVQNVLGSGLVLRVDVVITNPRPVRRVRDPGSERTAFSSAAATMKSEPIRSTVQAMRSRAPESAEFELPSGFSWWVSVFLDVVS